MAGEYAYTNGTPETSHCNLAELKTLCERPLLLADTGCGAFKGVFSKTERR